MPLVKSVLLDELSKFADQEHTSFTEFPPSKSEAASKWAAAINTYASAVVPVSTTAATAKTAFESTMLGLLNANSPDPFTTSFTAYATSLAAGMLPLFTGTPPASPIILAPVFPLGLGGASAATCLSSMCDIIDLWFKTGIAVNTSTGVSVTWL